MIRGAFDLIWSIGEELAGSLAEWFESIGFNGIAGFLLGIQEVMANIGEWIRENIFDPFINWLKDLFGIHSPSIVMAEMGTYIMQGLLNGIKALVGSVVASIQDVWNGIKKTFEGFIDFFVGVFTGNWQKAWDGIVKIFSGVGDTIKGIINGILGGVEALANGVINAINSIIRALNGLHFDLPDWLPGDLGGKTLGFNIGEIPNVTIPKLATGAVIRGGNPFMAILGDQPAGKTNIEAPLATIEQAVENAMNRRGYSECVSSGQAKIILSLNGTDVGEAIIDDLFSVMQRRGYDVDVLGVT